MDSGRECLKAAWERLTEEFWDRGRAAFYESRPRRAGDPVWAYNWGFGAVLSAAGAVWQALAEPPWLLPDLIALRTALRGYSRPRLGYASTSQWVAPGDTFYDDNAWIGLAAIDLRTVAEWEPVAWETYQYLLEGWDPASGGVFWKEHPKASWHVCSTGPAALLGALLYRIDSSRVQLGPIRGMLQWLDRLRAPDGRYWDHQRVSDGQINPAFHTYNAGTPIHAMAVLEEAKLPGFDFRPQVEATIAALPAFLTAEGALPPTPWFNAVLLRALKTAKMVYGIDSELLPLYRRAAADAWRGGDDHPFILPSRDTRDGVMLRDAAASVEILALLEGFPAGQPAASGGDDGC